jgi:hypothetical protein
MDLTRFDYPVTVDPVRVLGFCGDRVPDERPGMEGKMRYANVEYQVQQYQGPDIPVSIEWMSVDAWKQLVGWPDDVN